MTLRDASDCTASIDSSAPISQPQQAGAGVPHASFCAVRRPVSANCRWQRPTGRLPRQLGLDSVWYRCRLRRQDLAAAGPFLFGASNPGPEALKTRSVARFQFNKFLSRLSDLRIRCNFHRGRRRSGGPSCTFPAAVVEPRLLQQPTAACAACW